MPKMKNRAAGRLINTAPFHSNKTVLDDVNAADPMFPAKFVERLHYLKRRKLGGRYAVSTRIFGRDGARPSSFRSQAGSLRHTYAITGFKGKIDMFRFVRRVLGCHAEFVHVAHFLPARAQPRVLKNSAFETDVQKITVHRIRFLRSR